ncbi:uncharacterized protein PITG_11931 [Phytophthora infestans T30-4]|uniref:Uncharacterized protein n=1 Tax=Phytophthora infestans (strain T30-4) TaxID=403677 RepID=D0NHJ9_PHYIT|nr:uncharacterized protein PITG_11931 [Phytophthora infestans T30-4]EEY58924.1 conserved hypothetical protein [Phytophthora infestans T30-4]|eukprot:XP_002901397.1 conserved hypothetical protein [Phytophthora infestans T30-4]
MLAATTLVTDVNGHGYMTEPAVTFLSSSTDNTQFIATIEASASKFSGTFSGSPADNTAAFTTAFESSSYTSLKELINALTTVTVTDATLTCGSCDPDETAQPLPETTLTFYWLALHSSTWQVYINCAPLESTTSTGATSKYAVTGSSSSATTTNSTSTRSTASSAAEASTASSSHNFNTNFATSSSASTTDETSSAAYTDAPASTTTAPTTTTETPATATTTDKATTTPADTSKCSVRRRRN